MKHNKRIMIVILRLAFLFVLSLVVMLLWNALLPFIFKLPPIGFWQAVGLFLLSRILFGRFGYLHPHDRHFFERRNNFREKWIDMSPEERQRFIERRKEFRSGQYSHSENQKHPSDE